MKIIFDFEENTVTTEENGRKSILNVPDLNEKQDKILSAAGVEKLDMQELRKDINNLFEELNLNVKCEEPEKFSLYDEYYLQYRAAIDKDIAAGKKVDYIVKDYMWITMKLFEDRKLDPQNSKKMQELIEELGEKKEEKLLEAIVKTFEDISKLH